MFLKEGGGGDVEMRDDITQLTNTHGSEFPKVEASTTWTDYWVQNEMPEPLFQQNQIVVKLPEIDTMSYARGVGALVHDEEAEDEGWD